MKAVVIFDRFGPYHVARLKAASVYMEVVPIEVSAETSEYQWDKIDSTALQNQITLFKSQETKSVASAQMKKVVMQQLTEIQPDIVAVNGWYEPAALIALWWCLRYKVPAILMSESAAGDEPRHAIKEWVKQQIVQRFSAALVGGIRHKDYLQNLGVKNEKIFFGYDVVDNDHFYTLAQQARGSRSFIQNEKKLPENFFLVVSRFIKKKNLHLVIKAYHAYAMQAGSKPWHLVILGDGPLKEELHNLTTNLNINELIRFEGFKQYDELPQYFALAKVFIHASTAEQWGLVVNEAMASGLPVIVSERCGCVPELVKNGVNGFVINPGDQQALTRIMSSFAAGDVDVAAMGKQSIQIVAALNADAFGKGLYAAAKTGLNAKAKSFTLNTAILLRLILAK